MALALTKGDKKLVFRDVRSYTTPCSLDKFLKSWEAPFTKSIFPYQKYKSIEELQESVDFPDRSDFFNDLKQVTHFQNNTVIIL